MGVGLKVEIVPRKLRYLLLKSSDNYFNSLFGKEHLHLENSKHSQVSVHDKKVIILSENSCHFLLRWLVFKKWFIHFSERNETLQGQGVTKKLKVNTCISGENVSTTGGQNHITH